MWSVFQVSLLITPKSWTQASFLNVSARFTALPPFSALLKKISSFHNAKSCRGSLLKVWNLGLLELFSSGAGCLVPMWNWLKGQPQRFGSLGCHIELVSSDTFDPNWQDETGTRKNTCDRKGWQDLNRPRASLTLIASCCLSRGWVNPFVRKQKLSGLCACTEECNAAILLCALSLIDFPTHAKNSVSQTKKLPAWVRRRCECRELRGGILIFWSPDTRVWWLSDEMSESKESPVKEPAVTTVGVATGEDQEEKVRCSFCAQMFASRKEVGFFNFREFQPQCSTTTWESHLGTG